MEISNASGGDFSTSQILENGADEAEAGPQLKTLTANFVTRKF